MALRVAAYCRVSTENERQQNSLRAQKDYFVQLIDSNKDWSSVGVFCDEGESGTSTKRRSELLKLLKLAFDGQLDLIVTKDVSRFARNTLDTLELTRRLRRAGVGVFFLSDGINTLDADGEFRLTIMASVAQEESRKTSQRVRWGQRRAMESGKVFGNNSIYGYHLSEGKLSIDEKEAAVVRLIFRLCVKHSMGCLSIARELDRRGIKPRFADKWSQQSVLKILRNEKYMGDLLQKKFTTPDYLSHRKIKNPDLRDKVLIRAHHDPIVSKNLFSEAQRALDSRKKSNNAQNNLLIAVDKDEK